MTIYSLTPEYKTVHVMDDSPFSEVMVVDNRFVGHAGDLLSLLLRLNVIFHDSEINIKNKIIDSRLEVIVVRPVPGNYEAIVKDLNQAMDHIELVRMGGWRLPDGTTGGYPGKHAHRLGLSMLRGDLDKLRKQFVRDVIFEECPERLRASSRWGNDLRDTLNQLQEKLAEYRALEVVKQYPWHDGMIQELETRHKQRVAHEREIVEHIRPLPSDLLLPKEFGEVTPSEPLRDECRIDLSAMGLSQEQLTGLVEKAREFDAEYTVYEKGLVLHYIPFRDDFEEGVFDE